MLVGWLAKKWLYFRGIRFYESKALPSNAESIRTHFIGTTEAKEQTAVSFEFYREIYIDSVYRRGKFVEEETHVFIIKAAFDGKLEQKLLKFNDRRLICRNVFFRFIPDSVIAEILQGLYIAYMKNNLGH